MKGKLTKKVMSLVMTFAMALTMLPGLTAPAEANGCTHVHGEDCSYAAGAVCAHGHDMACGFAVGAPCAHPHDEDCGWDEEAQSGCTHAHDGACGYAEAAPCAHGHDEGCGYIAAADCDHQHDEACGGLPVDSGDPAPTPVEDDEALPETAESDGAEQGPTPNVTIIIAPDAQGYVELFLNEGKPYDEAYLLAGVAATDETGADVAVTVTGTGGLDLLSPQRPEGPAYPPKPYVITYGAAHPVTGDLFTATREVYVIVGIMAMALGDYDPAAVSVINGLIAINGLSATLNDPDSWGFATWDSSMPKQLTGLDLSNKGLVGVTYIQNISTLTTLNVSGNPGLNSLDCNNNALTSLNVTGCTGLRGLYCNVNALTSLDVNGLTGLTTLNCANNALTTLNVTGCTGLKSLYCSNNALTSLNVSGLTGLEDLRCFNNVLTSLNASGLTSLRILGCYSNALTSLNASGCSALETLDCYNNALTSLNVSGCSGLMALRCESNMLETLTLNAIGLTNLTVLYCYNNALTSLNVSGLTNLTVLYCYNNALTSLNVSGLTSLRILDCASNALTSLNVSGLTGLTALDCSNNELTSLNVSGLTSLTYLYCSNNALETLNVSGSLGLQDLLCNDNALTSLNAAGCSGLQDLQCHNNPLASLILYDRQMTVARNPAQGGSVRLTGYTHSTKSVTLTATAGSGYVFSGWTYGGAAIMPTPSATASPVSFDLPTGNVTVTASFAASLTVVSGTDITNSGPYAQGAVVTIKATDPPSGKVFDKWTGGNGGSFANVSSATTTFTMPGNAATVTATYKDSTTHALSVVNGTDKTGSGPYAKGTVVTIKAATPADGKVFYKWTGGNGGSFANVRNATTTFTMPGKAATVTATYTDITYTTSADTTGTIMVHGVSITYTIRNSTGILTLNLTADLLDRILEAAGENRMIAIDVGSPYGLWGLDILFPPSWFASHTDVNVFVQSGIGGIHVNNNLGMKYPEENATATVSLRKGSIKLSAWQRGNAVTWNIASAPAYIYMPYTPKAGADVNALVLYSKATGAVVAHSFYEGGRVYGAVNRPGEYDVKAVAVSFTDTASHKAKADITFASAHGLIFGISATTFDPDTAITRADFMMALGKLSGADVSGYQESSFTDVQGTDPAMPYIEWAVANAIVTGDSNGEFAPDAAITREQMAVMMVDYAKATGQQLPVTQQGVTFEDDADPQGSVTRAEAGSVLRRFVESVVLGK